MLRHVQEATIRAGGYMVVMAFAVSRDGDGWKRCGGKDHVQMAEIWRQPCGRRTASLYCLSPLKDPYKQGGQLPKGGNGGSLHVEGVEETFMLF